MRESRGFRSSRLQVAFMPTGVEYLITHIKTKDAQVLDDGWEHDSQLVHVALAFVMNHAEPGVNPWGVLLELFPREWATLERLELKQLARAVCPEGVVDG